MRYQNGKKLNQLSILLIFVKSSSPYKFRNIIITAQRVGMASLLQGSHPNWTQI